MPAILGANSASTGDLITNSCHFNTDAYCEFTPSSGSGSTQFTMSAWVKNCGAGALTEDGYIISGKDADNGLKFSSGGSNGKMQFIEYDGGDNSYYIRTNRLFRDPAAWFHVVLIYDAPDSTAGDRMRLYINGVRETSFSNEVQLPQDRAHAGFTRNTVPIRVGANASGSNSRFNGYLADVYFCDGQNYEPSEFGETDGNGVWIPKKADVSFGTNGFHLEFKETGTSANAAGIGADTSGNGNHFSVSGLDATNIGIDTPFNNYCTINSIYTDDGNNLVAADFSEGNRKMLSTVDGWKFGRGTFLLEAGKWYVEVKATEAGAGENGRFGLQPSQGGEALGNTDDNDTFEGFNVGLDSSNTLLQKLDTGSGSTIFSDFTSGSIAQLAIDLDNDKVWIGRNGTWYNNNNASTTLSPSNHDIALPSVDLGWVFGFGIPRNGSNNITFEYNWGNPSFAISSGNSDADGHGNYEYAVPSGFFAVNSKNLAEYG